MHVLDTEFVFVVGMHRSGTSAATGALVELFGFQAEANPVPSNPTGQWERLEMRPHVDLLLAASGGTWRQPSTDDRYSAGRLLGGYLRRAFTRHVKTPGVWKDPRLCLCIDYWLQLADQRGFDSKIVYVVRCPMQVAASLQGRNGFSLENGLALWERTNNQAMRRLSGRDAVVVEYDRLVANPREALEIVGAHIASGRSLDGEAIERAAQFIHERRSQLQQLSEDASVLCPTWEVLRGAHGTALTMPVPPAEPAEVAEILGQASIASRVQSIVRGYRSRRAFRPMPNSSVTEL